MSTFKLPDLGEGLADAEIVEWHVEPGAQVVKDQPMVSVETAKAVVEVPAPWSGSVTKLHGEPGAIIKTGEPLVEISVEGEQTETESAGSAEQDAGTVVGALEVGERSVREAPTGVARSNGPGVKATPAVRALARQLEVDLDVVTPSGPQGLITKADIERVARILNEVGPLEPLRGVRRSMARTMAQAHAEVVAVTLTEDADIDAWPDCREITLRLIRAIVAGCRSEPSLNAWYDSHAIGRRVLEKIDLGMAVDTPDGLFVPVLRDVGNRSPEDLREGLDRLKAAVGDRSVPPEELRGQTFTLSNFGTMAGRHATPIVVPPAVAILGSGKVRDAVLPVDRQPAVRRILPLSLTFDHRCVTGGEAARFMAAVIKDLEQAE